MQVNTGTPQSIVNMASVTADNTSVLEEIVGSEIIDGIEAHYIIDEVEAFYKYSVGDDGVTPDELTALHAALRSTLRPSCKFWLFCSREAEGRSMVFCN